MAELLRQRLQRGLQHRLAAPLLAALAGQGLLLAVLRPANLAPWPGGGQRSNRDSASGPGNHSRSAGQPQSAATAELLQLSRQLERTIPGAGPGNSLLSLPLPPPPPPAALMPAPATGSGSGSGSARGSHGSRPPEQPARPTSSKAGELPRQPAAGLELAQAVARGAGSALGNDGATEALMAVQRRQWWMDPPLLLELQRHWSRGRQATAPATWRDLPQALEMRRLPLAQAGGLQRRIGDDLHGCSLVSRQQITLLWRQGDSLWLLRLPLDGGRDNAGLTNS